MKFSDEMLMAYADGELDLVARAEIEEAMAHDPAIARAVERHRALASRLAAAYGGVLKEPIPERLAALVASPEPARVDELAARREARRIAVGRWQLPAWSAMAASVLVGLFVGMLLMRGPAPPYEESRDGLIARGVLAEGLATRLASASDESPVRIGTTFRDHQGRYCRSFVLQQEATTAGLACRSGDAWKVEVLAAAPPARGELRTAAAMPIAVLQAVDARIAGEPLDAAQEAAARDREWR